MATTEEQKINTAEKMLALEPGDAVIITQTNGKAIGCHVQRVAPAGSQGRSVLAGPIVTVGFGPGRWNREVDMDTVRAGYVQLERG